MNLEGIPLIIVHDLKLQFGGRTLFNDVNLKFLKGNCYGVIGANGAGKTTFLKILSGEIQSTGGGVEIPKGSRIAVLKQDHFAFENMIVLDTVIAGHSELVRIMKEKDAIYARENFSDEDGALAAELEAQFSDMNGWQAEADAGVLLSGLGIGIDLHQKKMSELSGAEKVKVLLAQALFGKPEVLLLDEPTNDLDLKAINWLENFIMSLEESTVIIVSHDRHFLNKVCTHICDIDFSQIKIFVGNYDFWYKSSQLAQAMLADKNKRAEEKIKDLQNFIQRFSANASKSKQATSRKKLLDKITLEDIQPSTRKYPFIGFRPEREAGDQLLSIKNLTLALEGVDLIKDLSLTIKKGQKVVFLAENELLIKCLFKVLSGEEQPKTGSINWGVTTSRSYLLSDHTSEFKKDLNLINWLRQYSKDQSETFLRGFLGRMLFSGEEALKSSRVLSGGEKVRCMLSKMMLSGANVLIMENPTNHLDLETITSLNEGLVDFKGTLLFSSHDHEFIQTIANRIIYLHEDSKMRIDVESSFDEYLENFNS